MDQDDIKDLYNEKYKKTLGINYEEWQGTGPQNEEEAYARLQEIDDELKASYDEWYEAEGELKEELDEQRDKLKAEYDFLEEVFGLEAPDKNW
ncbi:MAG: hypothetical protein KGJ93_03660 [Patescibacteria group bacterium]|nr:hypothetical protein [Patescibacteria group bacterium]